MPSEAVEFQGNPDPSGVRASGLRLGLGSPTKSHHCPHWAATLGPKVQMGGPDTRLKMAANYVVLASPFPSLGLSFPVVQ